MKKQLRTPYSTRQYMVNKDFEIYFYSDKSTPHVDAHSHNYYEFYFFIEGDVSIEIESSATKLKHGDIVVIPPGCKHRAIVAKDGENYSRFVFWISRDFFQYMFDNSVNYGYLIQQVITTGNNIYHNNNIAFNTIESKVFTLIEELSGNRFGKEEKIKMCVMDLMLHLNRTVYEANHPILASEENSLYENLLIYLDQHIDEELTLDRLAEEFYVSKYHIEHVFKDQMGLSLHQFIIRKRLENCRQLILSGRDIVDASESCGFPDYSSFYRAFKKEYGMSPKEYKRLYSPIND